MRFVTTFVWVAAFLQAQPAPPESLPGKGLAQHPFLYCGEWQQRGKSEQTMYILRGGKVEWSYSIPAREESGQVEKELVLKTRVPDGIHGQFRHIRMTKAGTFLVAH